MLLSCFKTQTNLITLFIFTDGTHWQILPNSMWSHRPCVRHWLVPPQWSGHCQRLRGLHSDGKVYFSNWLYIIKGSKQQQQQTIKLQDFMPFIATVRAVVTPGLVAGLTLWIRLGSNMCCREWFSCLLSWGHWLLWDFYFFYTFLRISLFGLRLIFITSLPGRTNVLLKVELNQFCIMFCRSVSHKERRTFVCFLQPLIFRWVSRICFYLFILRDIFAFL